MSEITPEEMISFCEQRISEKEKLVMSSISAFGHDNNRTWIEKQAEPYIAIRDFIQKHSDPSMVLVPVKPTLKMLEAAFNTKSDNAEIEYIAMIQAAKGE